MKAALFLDRDGTLIPDTGYPDDPAAISLLPQVGDALASAVKKGYILVLITNQSGIGRGYFTLETAQSVNQRLAELLQAFDVEFSGIELCPHRPNEHCSCRKPEPAMILRAARKDGIDLARSYMIGDKESDVLAGQAAGCRTVLIGTNAESLADQQVANLAEFVEQIPDAH